MMSAPHFFASFSYWSLPGARPLSHSWQLVQWNDRPAGGTSSTVWQRVHSCLTITALPAAIAAVRSSSFQGDGSGSCGAAAALALALARALGPASGPPVGAGGQPPSSAAKAPAATRSAVDEAREMRTGR